MKMLTKEQVLALVVEHKVEAAKTQKVPVYYKRKGQMVERGYPDYVYTDRYKELCSIIRSPQAQVFNCESCGKTVGYFDLETHICDFNNDKYCCAVCYEDAMGDDL